MTPNLLVFYKYNMSDGQMSRAKERIFAWNLYQLP